MNLVTPKAGAKQTRPQNLKPENKSSCLAPALCVTKVIIDIDVVLVALCCAF